MARRSICVISMSVADTWTSCASPLRRDASTAASDADASALPTWAAIRFMGLDSGGRGGVPLALTGPAIASATSCVAANPAYGPSSPQGVRLASTMPGWRAASASRLRPRSASSRRDRAARTRSAVAARSASSARSPAAAVSPAAAAASVTPRLLRLKKPKAALRSGSGWSAGNGPDRRLGSPSGSSTLMTSAPKSAKSFPANEIATPGPNLDHADLVQSLH